MTEEPVTQDASPSGDNNYPGGGELSSEGSDNRMLDIGTHTRHSSNVRTSLTKKAKRVRFFRNGDKFYTGVVMAVTPERYRSFDSLASDLTRALIANVTLPNGVRSIYTMDGRKVQSVDDLDDGKCYVASGQGEIFKKVEYSSTRVRRGNSLSGLPLSPAGTTAGRQISAVPLCVKARIVTLIRHGTKPRKVVRLLLNKRNAPSLEHAMEAITDAVKLDTGAVRKVYTLSGQQVTSLEHFFQNDQIFLAYGPEKSGQEDFELDFEESKGVQSFRRCPWTSKRQSSPMPRMPRKSGKKVLATPQVRTPSPSSLILPQPLRLHYAVGHVIGDGNFAVVRHCIHKLSGAEYAMKIVGKYKCQGKETMLASEVAIMRQVCHPNIISLIAEQETAEQLFLVLELVKGGDLFDAIATATKFSELEASVMIGHLTSALAYLHSHHIVHRDVKPENLLVEMDGSRVRCLKLGDFGLAQVVREPLYTVCGTPTYVAPEILAETGYGLKIDVWAAGVILYILLCGFPPFVSPENEQEELFERILSGQYEFTSPYWDAVSDSAKELISNMLQAQPELRFSAEDILDHLWLASFLGGVQTATSAPTDAPEQHWNQQREPLRLASFQYGLKEKSRGSSLQDISGGISRIRTSRGASFEPAARSKFHRKTAREADKCPPTGDRDQVDFNDRNSSDSSYFDGDDSPTTRVGHGRSMRNLFKLNHLNEYGARERRLKSQSAISSLRLDKSDKASGGSTFEKIRSTNSCSTLIPSLGTKAFREQSSSPLSTGRRNSNSLARIHFATLGKSPGSNLEETIATSLETPKLKKRLPARQRYKRKRLSEKFQLPDRVDIRFGSEDAKNSSNMVSFSSTESLTGSSSNNDIETSDSFVNIQFAQTAHSRSSSSSQSMESSDSFKNLSFVSSFASSFASSKQQDHRLPKNEKNHHPLDPNRNTCETQEILIFEKFEQFQQFQQFQQFEQEEQPRGRNKTRSMYASNTAQPKIPQETTTSRDPRERTRKNKKTTESKVAIGESSSSLSSSLASRLPRRFASTEERRDRKDEQQRANLKRFRFYYTPQPLRKNYAEGSNAKTRIASAKKDCVYGSEREEKKNRNTSRSLSSSTTATAAAAAAPTTTTTTTTTAAASRNKSNNKRESK